MGDIIKMFLALFIIIITAIFLFFIGLFIVGFFLDIREEVKRQLKEKEGKNKNKGERA